MKNIKKYKLINFISIFILIMMSLIVNTNSEIGIKGMIAFSTISYLIVLITLLLKYKNFKSLLISCEFVFETIYMAYALPAAICFLIDGGIGRIAMFRITQSTILKTLIIYYNINIVFIVLLLLRRNDIKNYDFIKNKLSFDIKFNKINIFDIIALLLTGYFIWKNLKDGLITSNISYYTKRSMLSLGNIYDYIFMYMIAYCYSNYYLYAYNKTRIKLFSSKLFLVIILAIFFWGISLFTGRRYFIFLILLLTFVIFSKVKKIKLKSMLILGTIICSLLFLSFYRMHLKQYTFKDVYYFSFGEFINVNYVSNYYMCHDYELQYGKTYILNTITYLLPSKIYKNKPKTLALEFMNKIRSNYGLAFNPIAEGLINFGEKWIYLFLPLVFIFYTNLAYKLGKIHNFLYFIVASETINFMRGQFATSIFSIAFIGILSYLIVVSNINMKYINNRIE